MKKAELRIKYLTKREKLNSGEAEQMSVEIIELLTENFDLKHKKISIFLPIAKFNEINTWPLLNLECTFVLPVVKLKENILEHIIFERNDQIRISNWGIPEPTYGKDIQAIDLDFVLVPLVAYDKTGNRVGYGKGFYDNFLVDCKHDCIFIGLSYFGPEDVIHDNREDDVKLDYCVTPHKIIKFD